MQQPELLDAAVVRAWLSTSARALATARAEIDRVNVFPVADGDTGTNMYLTVRDAATAVGPRPKGRAAHGSCGWPPGPRSSGRAGTPA